VVIIAYFGMTEWLNHYVVGKIAFELGTCIRWLSEQWLGTRRQIWLQAHTISWCVVRKSVTGGRVTKR